MTALRQCAVITGGGGLLGRAMATAFARQGMNVVVADINPALLKLSVEAIQEAGGEALAVETDVGNAEAMEALAAAAYDRFGQVNRLCLNAGKAMLKPFEQLTRADWDAVMGPQWNGVLNGILAFLPRLIEQGGDRHIVLTSSMSGVGRADLRTLNAPYVVAKFATVGLTEVMAPSLEKLGIGTSVLCPGFAVANPESHTSFSMPSAEWYKDNLLNAGQVADEVLKGIEEKRLYIFTHRSGREEVLGRHERLMQGFDQADRTAPERKAPPPKL